MEGAEVERGQWADALPGKGDFYCWRRGTLGWLWLALAGHYCPPLPTTAHHCSPHPHQARAHGRRIQRNAVAASRLRTKRASLLVTARPEQPLLPPPGICIRDLLRWKLS